MARKRRIKVIYRKLGKEKVWGWCHHGDCIEIDPALKGKKFLEILIHECLHYVNPDDDEDEIIRKSVLITNTLWHEGVMRVDKDNSQPLQDGSL